MFHPDLQDYQNQEQIGKRKQRHPYEHRLQEHDGGRNAVSCQAAEVQVHRALQQVQPLLLRAEAGQVRRHHGDVQHVDEPGLAGQFLQGRASAGTKEGH